MTGSSTRPDAIVIGAGIIGLVTALCLRERGLRVEVWTRDDPWQTTSSVAAAIWYPFLAEPRERCLAWGMTTFERLRALARDPQTGVRMQSVVEVFATEDPDLWWTDGVPGVDLQKGDEVPAGYRAALRTRVPVCDVPIHLRWLLDTLGRQEVALVQRQVADLAEALSQSAAVINCTGLGARELCGDRQLQAVRGQVVQLRESRAPHAWIDDTGGSPCYVVPRQDGLIVGGTAQMDDENLEPDDRDTKEILQQVATAFPDLARCKPDVVRVGLRPYRSTVRLECEELAHGQRLVHNYGHGGSGYTLAWGCAEDVASWLAG